MTDIDKKLIGKANGFRFRSEICTLTNFQCACCGKAHNGINGRYCNLIGRYVEYCDTPPCCSPIQSK